MEQKLELKSLENSTETSTEIKDLPACKANNSLTNFIAPETANLISLSNLPLEEHKISIPNNFHKRKVRPDEIAVNEELSAVRKRVKQKEEEEFLPHRDERAEEEFTRYRHNMRPKRVRKTPQYLNEMQNIEDVVLEVLKCQKYNDTNMQPFDIFVSLECLMLMNLHAHLTKNEIIGFVGGQILVDSNTQKRKLFIQKCYPCIGVERNEDASVNVEMSPESEAKAKEMIDCNQQKILGWYHSHATFNVSPSDVDVRNQFKFQEVFRGDGQEFIAIIISPYNKKVKSDGLSELKFFHVNKKKPYELKACYLPQKYLEDIFYKDISEVIDKFKNKKYRIDFQDFWGNNTIEKAGEESINQGKRQNLAGVISNGARDKQNKFTLFDKLLKCLWSLLSYNSVYFEEHLFKHKLHFMLLLNKAFTKEMIEQEFEFTNNDPNLTISRLSQDYDTDKKNFVKAHDDRSTHRILKKISGMFRMNWGNL